jgi:hypothetical protein
VNKAPTLLLVLIAVSLTLLLFAIEGTSGLSLTDEGYLWYGTIQVLHGRIPIRDFQAYEPGRYYWGAAWLWLLRDQGLLALRFSSALFAAIGVACGTLALRRVMPSAVALTVAAAVMALWVHPRYRAFEATITLVAIWLSVRLLESESPRRWFALGCWVGVAACFGRNHGLYLTLASVVLLVAVGLRKPGIHRRLQALALGGLVGALPLLGMMAAVPGFAASMARAVLYNISFGTNASIPVPWPWRVAGPLFAPAQVSEKLLGCLFLTMALTLALAAITAWRCPESDRGRVLIAAACVGLPYLHHAFSRADMVHLSSSVQPTLIAALSLLSRLRPTLLAPVLLSAVSAIAILPERPLGQRYLPGGAVFVRTQVGEDWLWVPGSTAAVVDSASDLGRRMAPDENVFIAPLWPTLYPVLKRAAPCWRLEFSMAAPPGEDAMLVDSLNRNNVTWAIVCNSSMDGRESARLSHAYPVLWRELRTWTRLSAELPAACRMLHRTAEPAPLQ